MNFDFADIRRRQIEIFGQASPLVQSGVDAVPARLAAAYRAAQGLEPVPFDALPDVMQGVWRRVAQSVQPPTPTPAATSVVGEAFKYFNSKTAQSFSTWLCRSGASQIAVRLYKEFPDAGPPS